jgi:hypothetical protein
MTARVAVNLFLRLCARLIPGAAFANKVTSGNTHGNPDFVRATSPTGAECSQTIQQFVTQGIEQC